MNKPVALVTGRRCKEGLRINKWVLWFGFRIPFLAGGGLSWRAFWWEGLSWRCVEWVDVSRGFHGGIKVSFGRASWNVSRIALSMFWCWKDNIVNFYLISLSRGVTKEEGVKEDQGPSNFQNSKNKSVFLSLSWVLHTKFSTPLTVSKYFYSSGSYAWCESRALEERRVNKKSPSRVC